MWIVICISTRIEWLVASEKTHPLKIHKKFFYSLLHYEQNLCSYLYLAVVKISLKMPDLHKTKM